MYNMYSNPNFLDTSTSAVTATSTAAGLVGAIFGVFTFFGVLIAIACAVLVIIGRWKIFTKAGKDGWKSLIPIYSTYTMLQILNMEPLLCLLALVPVSNFMLSIVMSVKLAQSFKKGYGFAIGLILLAPIFELILGFGSAKYTQLPSSK